MKVDNIPDDIIQYYQKYRRTKDIQKFQTNFGYFEIDTQYEFIKEVIGKWANAIICRDINNKQLVVIKKTDNQYLQDSYLCKKLLRNLKLQRILKHENILGLNNIILPQSREDFKNMQKLTITFYRYYIREALDIQLIQIIRSQQQLTDDHYKFFIYQILKAVKYFHSANIIHRNLSPRNILLNIYADIKITSFTDSKIINPAIIQQPDTLTNYVTTRWYRAPEVLLGSTKYDYAIDIWAVGCIFAELMLRKPIFPGMNCLNQLELIINLLGTPKLQNFNIISKTQFQKFIDHFGQRPPLDLVNHIPQANELALDLLKKLLTFDPSERITAVEALNHPYLEELHDLDDEPVSEPLNMVDFEFETLNLNLEQLKDCIYEEILLYHFTDFRQEYERRKSIGQSIYSKIINNSNRDQKQFQEDQEDKEYKAIH